MKLDLREKAILCGLYLSKFDEKGLNLMGFSSFKEAYNVLGFSLGVKPTSIKNYRDELDPLFPNARRGWVNRPLRTHCRQVYENFNDYSVNQLFALIVSITDAPIWPSTQKSAEDSLSFARRLLTGRAAENYFSQNYQKERHFTGMQAEDVTHTGCGYDFKLHRMDSSASFAVEVKGLAAISGNIALTVKEYNVAERLKNGYFIYVVKNFNETPFPLTIRNPIHADLTFKREERRIIQISWSAKV